MLYRNRCAKINVKLIVVLILVTVALAISLVGARQTRRSILSERALKAGEIAFETEDWQAAAKSYREYLSRNPDDVEILRKYAEACLSTRPLNGPAITGAVSAYRRVIQLAPGDQTAYEKLAVLYRGVKNFPELAAIARARLEQDPDDRKATLWLADALTGQNKTTEARQALEALIAERQALPERHDEFVQACVRMAQLVGAETGSLPETTSDSTESPEPQKLLEWLDKAVEYAPDSAEALAYRARFRRAMANAVGTSEDERSALLVLAHKDLDVADSLIVEDPRIRFFLGAEWMAHGELDRATAQVQATDRLAREKLKDYFLDISDWTVTRFRLASELATRKGDTAEAAALADEVLSSLTEEGRRIQILPSVIPLYVAARRVAEARQSLDEYADFLRAQEQPTAESQRTRAGLQALVAGAENKPYAVIDAAEPIIGDEPAGSRLWRLLAEAYDRTGQAGRAVKALEQYRRLNPEDPQMMRALAKQYSKLGHWKQTFETASMAESLDSTDLVLKLLRIGAAVNLAAGQAERAGAGDLTKLSAELEELRRAHPDEVGIRILQAIIADHLGQPGGVERQLKLAAEQCKEPLKAEMQLARHYLGEGRVAEAIRVHEAACQRHPQAADPWLSLADIDAAKTDYESARSCLERGLKTVTESSEKRSISIKLALLELVYGDRTAGINLLRQSAAQEGADIRARSLLLGIREVREDPAVAQELVDELRRAEGESGVSWRLHQASLWLSSEDWASHQKDIADLLLYCIEADPAWPAPVLLLAGLYGRLGDFGAVEDTYRRGLLGNPSATDIAARLLALLEGQGRFSDAERVLQQVRVNPRIASTWQVRMALGAGDFSRAIDELKLRVSDDDQDASSRVQLARLLYQETKDADQALRYLNEAETIDSSSRTLAAVRASILTGEGKTAEALRVLDDYVADHNDFNAYWMRAVYLDEEGQLDQAEQDYKRLTTFTQNSAVGYGLLGDFYARTDRIDQGITTIEEGLGAHPEDLRLKRTLMRLLFARARAEDRARALKILSELEEQMPQDTELATVRAAEMLRDPTPQSFSSIMGKLDNAVKLQPRAVKTHLALIGIAMRQGQYQTACDCAVRAQQSNPNDPALLSARSRAELALGYVSMAVKLAREALQKDPNNTEALCVIADSALNSREHDLLEEARTLIDSALTRNPASDRLQVSRARVSAVLGLPEAAIPQLQMHCQTQEGRGSIPALITLADLYRLAGDAERAMQCIERAERLGSNNQAVVHARFLWLASQNRFEELLQISSKYLSAVEQDPMKLLSAASMLISLDSMDHKKEAVKLFEQAATLAPTSLNARLGLASSLYQTGNLQRAEDIYQELLEQHPDDTRVLNDLAWIVQQHNRQYADALQLANRGLRLAPDDPHLLDTRGTILSNMPDHLDDAKSDFEKLVRLSSSDDRRRAKALLQLGRICAKLGDLPQARQCLENAMDIDQKLRVFTPSERSEISEIIGVQGGS